MPKVPEGLSFFHDQFSQHPQSVAERLRQRKLAAIFRRIGEDQPVEEDEGPGWLDLTPESTEEEVEAACKVAFTQPPPPRGTRWLSWTGHSSNACPLTVDWKLWDIGVGTEHDFRWVPDDDLARCEEARGAMPAAHAGRIKLSWCFAADSCDGGEALSHIHADTVVDGHVVHIDRLGVQRFGPGRSLTEIRIFVDGALAGRAGTCGCSLGAGGGDLPAVARITLLRAITVDVVRNIAFPIVELWEVTP